VEASQSSQLSEVTTQTTDTLQIEPRIPPTNTGKQQHGNAQVALCAGGNLQATPGFVGP